ncbi:MAG: hypothetical protein ACRDLP_16300 [Solirubrobacteraceae bacterium]
MPLPIISSNLPHDVCVAERVAQLLDEDRLSEALDLLAREGDSAAKADAVERLALEPRRGAPARHAIVDALSAQAEAERLEGIAAALRLSSELAHAEQAPRLAALLHAGVTPYTLDEEADDDPDPPTREQVHLMLDRVLDAGRRGALEVWGELENLL